jgi:hypothetical protein
MTKARLLVAAIGLVALSVPAAAQPRHVQAHRAQPQVTAPATTNSAWPRDFSRYDGYQTDRQLVGLQRL